MDICTAQRKLTNGFMFKQLDWISLHMIKCNPISVFSKLNKESKVFIYGEMQHLFFPEYNLLFTHAWYKQNINLLIIWLFALESTFCWILLESDNQSISRLHDGYVLKLRQTGKKKICNELNGYVRETENIHIHIFIYFLWTETLILIFSQLWLEKCSFLFN